MGWRPSGLREPTYADSARGRSPFGAWRWRFVDRKAQHPLLFALCVVFRGPRALELWRGEALGGMDTPSLLIRPFLRYRRIMTHPFHRSNRA